MAEKQFLFPANDKLPSYVTNMEKLADRLLQEFEMFSFVDILFYQPSIIDDNVLGNRHV